MNSEAIGIEDYIKAESFYTKVKKLREPTQGDIIIPYRGLTEDKKDEGKLIHGIIVITNKCDITHKRAKYISYLPIYRTSDLLRFTSTKDKEGFRKIIILEHPVFFFLPPHPLIDSNLGGIVNYHDIRSETKEIFYQKNPKPTLTLNRPYIDKLCSKIAYFFNRIPITSPEIKEIENWIEKNKNILNIISYEKAEKIIQDFKQKKERGKTLLKQGIDQLKELINGLEVDDVLTSRLEKIKDDFYNLIAK